MPENSKRSIESTARSIFGEEDEASVRRWVEYWEATRRRTEDLLAAYQKVIPIDFENRDLLDIGCGTGAMGEFIDEPTARYFGADYHRHVLQFARSGPRRRYLQCSAVRLPFADNSFDLVFAFDVIEHLVGGRSWQLEFLRELKRVLRPLGLILLTTPNFYYPYDAHTELYGPQFLPRFLRNPLIERLRPGFIKEHHSFDAIRLVTPRFLRRAIKQSGLACLHELPCGLDRRQFWKQHPLWGWLTWLGLGWYPHAEFWPILVHQQDRSRLRLKLRSGWFYEQNQSGDGAARDFQRRIDFDREPFGRQLGRGWYWHERDRSGFRWTSGSSICYLQSRCPVRFLRIEGFSPFRNELEVLVDGLRVGHHKVEAGREFRLCYLLPFTRSDRRIFEVELVCAHTSRSETAEDERELGVMIFALELDS